MIELNCPRCGRALRSDLDRHRLLHARCVGGEKRVSPQMTAADWSAVAGWLDPGRTPLTGRMGSE